ncbi:energy transducer TonB [Brucellaceae bacterium C25G]
MRLILSLTALLVGICINAGHAQQPPSYEDQLSLTQQIKRCYRLPIKHSGEAVIQFKLLDSGKVTNIEITKAGKLANYAIALAAVRAVNECQPYKTSIRGIVTVPFIFKYIEQSETTSAPL